jgi:hypothetical protein
MKRGVWFGLSLLPLFAVGIQTPPKPAASPVEFEGQIRPILKAKCYSCHSGENLSGKLDLSNREGVMRMVTPGKAATSLLYKRIMEDLPGKPIMPMGFNKLPAKEVELIQAWIDQGASFEPVPNFEHDILPIFRANCSGCHSGEKLSANLDLTNAKAVMRVVKTGDPTHSELIRRLKGLDGKPQMPMGFKPIPADKIAQIERWIKLGAPEKGAVRQHWAYVPVSKPDVPTGTGFWHPVDAFVAQKLKSEGLGLSKPASRETLIRRLSLDLIGLPPTPEETDAFLKDTAPGAYERVVDRLLANPQYGVRMARPWLDLARYADTNGYEKDNQRTMWLYRDWVVNAFNRNQPFDQFTVDQIAGDLLPKRSQDQLIATGFNRNTMHNLEGGVDQDEAMYQVINDRVATTTTTWLGQTLACAQCHDHKYDPLSQRDYFRFYAFFNRNQFEERGPREVSEMKYFEPQIRAATLEQQARLNAWNKRIGELDAALGRLKQVIRKEQDENASPEFKWEPLVPTVSPAPKSISPDGAIRMEKPESVIRLSANLNQATGIKITTLPLADLPAKGAGSSPAEGNFILSRVVVKVGEKVIPLKEAAASFVQGDFRTRGVLDEDIETGWAVYSRTAESHQLGVNFGSVVSGPATIELHFESKRWPNHMLMSFRVEAGNYPNAAATVLPKERFAEVANSSRVLRAERDQIAREKSALEATIPTALVMRDRKGTGPLTAPVRSRGEFLSPGELVQAETPAALGTPAKGNRLSLAKWLVDKRNPLTARVQVNRLWEMLFGRGLVETSENFGTQGSSPSHPQLLDWLSAKYMESGWDTKAMMRILVTSNTYRQRSELTPDLLKKDPENRLLARAPRFRLEAETIRDSALRASGLLSMKLGGPSVFPEQPDGVWDSPYSGEQWMESTGENRYRRSIYTFYKRTAPYPLFKAFDASSRETCLVRRTRTNTPLQSLALLNDEGLFEAAKALGKRAESEGLETAFRRVLGRKPEPAEQKRLQELRSTLEARFAKTPDEAKKLGGPKLAALVGVANVILNLDEAISKE